MADKHEIYRGKARIMNIGVEEMSEKQMEKLPERDRGTAFQIVFDCETLDASAARYDIKVEISHRELTGKALEWNKREDGQTPTQLDIAVKDLVKQGLLPKGSTEQDIGAAMADDNIGREVTISITEDAKGDGTYWPARGRFISPFARLTGAAAADRLTAFLSGKKPEPKVDERPAPTPAPEDDATDPEDMPF